MIDRVLITPHGERMEDREDILACLYAVERGLWTACGWNEREQAVELDWGGTPRQPTKGFSLPSDDWACRKPPGVDDYKFDLVQLVASDYVSDVEGEAKRAKRSHWESYLGVEQYAKVLLWRGEGMPVAWIAERLGIGKGMVARPAAEIACKTIETQAGRRLLKQAYNEGAQLHEICAATGLSRRFVRWVAEEWKPK